MSEIGGVYRDGHVELNSAVDWPNGLQVTISPCPRQDDPPGTRLPSVRLADGTIVPWSDTAEFRQALVEQMDSREAVELSPAEEAEWQAASKWFGDYTLEAVKREMGLRP